MEVEVNRRMTGDEVGFEKISQGKTTTRDFPPGLVSRLAAPTRSGAGCNFNFNWP